MPFTNLNNRHFSEPEKSIFLSALDNLEAIATPKLANLSAEERQKYGSVNEQNKLIVNKVKDFRDGQPNLSSPDVDWIEFQNDYNTRNLLQMAIQRLTSIMEGLNNAKTLHDWDNWQASLTDYDYSKYKASTQAAGYQTKVTEIGQFFTGGAK